VRCYRWTVCCCLYPRVGHGLDLSIYNLCLFLIITVFLKIEYDDDDENNNDGLGGME